MNDDTSMNSPDLDPLHELASAHLDGATSAEERAQVQSSAQLTDIVNTFTELRAQLAEVPPAGAAVRDAGIAAALAAFDDLHSTQLAATPADAGGLPAAAMAPVVHLAARRRWPAFVMSAAAGLALLGIAGVAVFGGGSNDEASSATVAEAREMSATAEAAMDTMAAGDVPPPPTIGNISAPGSVAMVIEAPEQLLGLPLPDADTQAAPEAYAKRAAFDCLSPTQVFLADILYLNELAIAARDTVTGVTVAITDDCRVLVAVGP